MDDKLMRHLMRPVDARGKKGILSRGKNVYRGGFTGPTQSKNKNNINQAIMERFRAARSK